MSGIKIVFAGFLLLSVGCASPPGVKKSGITVHEFPDQQLEFMDFYKKTQHELPSGESVEVLWY